MRPKYGRSLKLDTMKIYINKLTGEKITEDTYNQLYSFRQDDYKLLESSSSSGDPLLSGIIGYATDSALLGGLLGGSLLGGIAGDALNDNDDSPFW